MGLTRQTVHTTIDHLVADGRVTKILLGIGTPLLNIIIWVIFVAPKAAVSLVAPVKVILGLVILEAAALALPVAAQTPVDVAFGVIVLINAALMLAWGQ